MRRITDYVLTFKDLNMKNYFGFSLTGSKLFPIWLLFYVLFVVPFVFLMVKISSIDRTSNDVLTLFGMLGMVFLLIIIELLVVFYISKILIENVQYNNLKVGFNGRFLNYLGVLLLGMFLTIITIGIYYPWFIKRLMSFYVDNSELEKESFKFKGSGSKLFVIYLLAVVIPTIFVAILGFTVIKSCIDPDTCAIGYNIVYQAISFLFMIPFLYLYYKWIVNIDYKNYNVRFDTRFWNSCGKLALEFFLSIITIGIYSPMAWLRLYKYFTDRTVAQSNEAKRSLGFESNYWPDFFFIWGQLLLTIFTLGLYYPWMISEVGKRILSRTYLE